MIAGLGFLLLVLIGIAAYWLRFSAVWNKEEALKDFLEKNHSALLEMNVPVQLRNISQNGGVSVTNWDVCDLFMFPQGIILRGRKNEKDFHDCIFLYNNLESRREIPRCKIRGIYDTPVAFKNVLSYELQLVEAGVVLFSAGPVKLDLFPSEKTMEIMRKNNYL
jgi:hypothetical protein